MITICPHPDESSYTRVEVVNGFCEVGGDCPAACQFAWRGAQQTQAIRAFERAFPVKVRSKGRGCKRDQWDDE